MQFYHTERSKVKEIEILTRFRFSPSEHGGYEILRPMTTNHVTYFPPKRIIQFF